MRTFLKTAAFIAGLVTSVAPVFAQNYDAAFQVRSGVFGQWGIFTGDTVRPAGTGDFEFRSLGVGATAGIEYVRKESWSYGIEVDGTVLSGETKAVPGSQYAPNYSVSMRLRAGQHFRPDLFWYGTMGLAALGAEIRTTAGNTKVTGTKAGFVLGFGLEKDFGPGLWFAEYLYSDYNPLGINTRLSYETQEHALRVGVKFKVGHDHYHDDVSERIGRTK
jgi:Outer membrane protein beta-barrel domain